MGRKIGGSPYWLAVLALLLPGAGQTEALNGFDGLYMYNDAGGSLPLPANQLYDRKNWPRLGGVLIISAYDGVSGRFYPEEGERWVIRLNDAESGQALSTLSIEYDAASDCLYSGGNELMCDITPEEDFHTRHSFITLRYALSCVPTANYDIDITHEYPAGTELVGESPYAFRPTRFEPKIISTTAPLALRPHLTEDNFLAGHPQSEIPPEQGAVNALVYDATGCGRPMDNVEMQLTAKIVPGTGSHKHFDGSKEQEMAGTGSFVPLNGSLDELSLNDTRIKGVTRNNGNFNTAYKAGEFGLVEELEIIARLPATADEPEVIDEIGREIELRLDGLIAMPTQGPDYMFVYGGTCKHDPLATYMFPVLREAVLNLAYDYRQRFNAILSFNDASLQFGGRFDNWTGTRKDSNGNIIEQGLGGREWNCHESHRRGIDIDVNSPVRSVDARNLVVHDLGDYVQINGSSVKRVDFLTTRACMLGLKRVKEPSIHYRWVGYCEVQP